MAKDILTRFKGARGESCNIYLGKVNMYLLQLVPVLVPAL